MVIQDRFLAAQTEFFLLWRLRNTLDGCSEGQRSPWAMAFWVLVPPLPMELIAHLIVALVRISKPVPMAVSPRVIPGLQTKEFFKGRGILLSHVGGD